VLLCSWFNNGIVFFLLMSIQSDIFLAMNPSFNAQPTANTTRANTMNRHKNTSNTRKNPDAPLGIKNILILFFSAMAISLVVLVLFFGLFFQKIDFSLNTKPLDSVSTPIEATQQPTETTAPIPPADEIAETFNEIQLNVPTDARNMPANNNVPTGVTPPNPSGNTKLNSTNTTKKQAPTATPFVGVGEPNDPNNDDFELPPNGTSGQESASDVMIESAPPLPPPPSPSVRGKKQKTAPVAENNKGSAESELMPMAPIPNGN